MLEKIRNHKIFLFQVNCGDTEDPGYGKRKKRSLYQRNSTASTDNIYMGKTKNWEENLELKIRMPPDLLVSQTNSKSMTENNHESRPLRESECKIYLIVTLSVALTFCVLSATIVVVACFKKYQVGIKSRIFYLPCKKCFFFCFFAGLQIFLHAGCDFLHPEELPPHAKTNECVHEVYKFGQEFFTIGIFRKFLYKYLKTIPVKAA